MTKGGLAEPRRDMVWELEAMPKVLVTNCGRQTGPEEPARGLP